MKILITADLHYDIMRSRNGACELAEQACREGGDALVLVGDSAGANLQTLRECLRLFADFAGRRLLVMGNHCLWCQNGEDSLARYERLIPELASGEGFEVLDHSPVVLGTNGSSVGLAGSVGWYDYTFRDDRLSVPEAFYRAKVAPGAANYFQEHRHLVESHRDVLSERHLEMSCRWMDGVHVRLGMSDEEFLAMLKAKLRSHLESLSRQASRIVVFTHHVPFKELIPADRPDRFAFAAAYMGSGALGEVMLEFPKVTHAYCGHSHWPLEQKIGRVRAVNVGSTYTDKKLHVLDLQGED